MRTLLIVSDFDDRGSEPGGRLNHDPPLSLDLDLAVLRYYQFHKLINI